MVKYFHTEIRSEKEKKINDKIKKIGETNHCPYCKKKLDRIPKNNSKCPHCGKLMYSRTIPIDRKKILITESQKEEVSLLRTKYIEAQEEARIMEDPEFISAKNELIKQHGKEPSIDDITQKVYRQRTDRYISEKQWSDYRWHKYDIADFFEKRNKKKQALCSWFEVFYLSINGPENIRISDKKMEECRTEGFNPVQNTFIKKTSEFILSIGRLSSELKFTEEEAKELFISTNKQMKPVKSMPISEEEAWMKLSEMIESYKLDKSKTKNFDTKDVDAIIKEIKNREKMEKSNTFNPIMYNSTIFNPIMYKFRNKYKNKKMVVSDAEKIKKVLKALLYSSTSASNRSLGASFLAYFFKKSKDSFNSLGSNYIRHRKRYFERHADDKVLYTFGIIEPKWVEPLIPAMIKTLRHPNWDKKRLVVENLIPLASSCPELIKKAIPTMVRCIKNIGYIKEIGWNPVISVKYRLKRNCIHALATIAKRKKELISEYVPFFSQIAKKDKCNYCSGRAKEILKLFQ